MIARMFEFLIRLYPANFRAEFEDEMRYVFLARAQDHRGSWTEIAALIRGAARERTRQILECAPAAASLATGAILALGSQALLYRALLKHGFVVCMFAGLGIAVAQPLPTQDPATLELAKSIYSRAFAAMRDAKTMDDMKKLADSLETPGWISVDRFGRTILNLAQAEGAFESILALAPDRRVPRMDIIWAEHDSSRLIVVAWMGPRDEDFVDGDGRFGVKGANHKLTRATLIRDIFESTASGWRRVQHDKILPDGTALTVDGKVLAEQNRVAAQR